MRCSRRRAAKAWTSSSARRRAEDPGRYRGRSGARRGVCFNHASPAQRLSSCRRRSHAISPPLPVNASEQPEGSDRDAGGDARRSVALPGALTLRTLGGGSVSPRRQVHDESLSTRACDANIKTNADLITKATFYDDPNFPNRRAAREQAERGTVRIHRSVCTHASRCKRS